MASLDCEETLPEFDQKFFQPSPFFYFLQVIDPEKASLTVEVIGPNLSFTFTHSQLGNAFSQSRISIRLENKTVGFLALVSGSGKRIVLAWAESGHGIGRFKDALDSKHGALSNKIWTRRTIAIGNLLGLSMGSPFDDPGGKRHARRDGERRKGCFQGGHVEVKLAVHAIFVLLHIFGITSDFNNVTKDHLRKLRHARWTDGTRPAFEIYFSRKNCHTCALLVGKLEEVTGVAIRFEWRHRLERKKYSKKPMAKLGNGLMVSEDEDMVDLTEDVDSLREDTPSAEPDTAIDTVNLTDEPPPREVTQHSDDFIDGMAYCTGQIQESPEASRLAIIHFAEQVLSHRGGHQPEIRVA